MENIEDSLNFYKLTIDFNEDLGGHTESGMIATEVSYDTVFNRLNANTGVKDFTLDKVDLVPKGLPDAGFSVNLIELNQIYSSLEDLKKDYMVAKIAGVI